MSERATIWVVDDDHSIRWVLEKALEKANMDVKSFPSASNILNTLERSRPDVLITDVRMPGMSGEAVAEAVAKLDERLPVILITAYGDIKAVTNYARTMVTRLGMSAKLGPIAFEEAAEQARRKEQEAAELGKLHDAAMAEADRKEVFRNRWNEMLNEKKLRALKLHNYYAISGYTRVAKEFGTSQAPVREALRDLEGLGDLHRDADRVLDGKRSPGDLLRQRLALGHLHDQEALAFDVLEAVDTGDVRVRQSGEDAGLALEALQALGVLGEALGQHLQGDVAAELGVLGPPDLAHPPPADDLEQPQRVGDLLVVPLVSADHGDSEDVGPLRPSELLDKVRSGEVRPETMLRKDDSAYFQASDVGGLFAGWYAVGFRRLRQSDLSMGSAPIANTRKKAMSVHYRLIATLMIIATLIAGCGKSEPTATPLPATATQITRAATNTPLPPTAPPALPTVPSATLKIRSGSLANSRSTTFSTAADRSSPAACSNCSTWGSPCFFCSRSWSAWWLRAACVASSGRAGMCSIS
mgnify:CR=1 FL=1